MFFVPVSEAGLVKQTRTIHKTTTHTIDGQAMSTPPYEEDVDDSNEGGKTIHSVYRLESSPRVDTNHKGVLFRSLSLLRRV